MRCEAACVSACGARRGGHKTRWENTRRRDASAELQGPVRNTVLSTIGLRDTRRRSLGRSYRGFIQKAKKAARQFRPH